LYIQVDVAGLSEAMVSRIAAKLGQGPHLSSKRR